MTVLARFANHSVLPGLAPSDVRLPLLFAVALACALVGCFRLETAPPKTVELTGDDDMKFNVTTFEVKPAQKVTLTLKNIGELPKEAMSHNWVLLEQATDAAKLAQTGFEHPESDYILPNRSVYVLAKTKLVGPGESDTITFAAPRNAGSYEYVCTFPDHYARGMKGTMMVAP